MPAGDSAGGRAAATEAPATTAEDRRKGTLKHIGTGDQVRDPISGHQGKLDRFERIGGKEYAVIIDDKGKPHYSKYADLTIRK